MAGKATLVINSDSKDGQKAIESLIKEMTKLKEENKKLAEENKKAAAEDKKAHQEKMARVDEERRRKRETSELMRRAALEEQKAVKEAARLEREQLRIADQKARSWLNFGTTIMTTAGAYVSLNAILAETEKYLARQAALQKEIAQHNVAAGKSQQETILNMQGVTSAQLLRALQGGKDINLRTGFGDVNAINRAYGKALSASEGNFGRAEGAVEASASLSAGDPEKLNAYTQAALDIGLPSGKSAEESLGLALSAGAQARVTNPAQAAQLFAKSAASGAALDKTGNKAEAARQRVVLAATITGGIKDPTGDVSKTASINLGAKLAEFFEGTPGDPMTERGRIEALWADPRRAQQFDDKYNFEAEANDFINSLLKDKDSAAAKLYRSFDTKIGWNREAYEQTVKSTVKASPQTRANQRSNQRASITQAGHDVNASQGLVDEARQLYEGSKDIYEGQFPGEATVDDSFFNIESWNTKLHHAINTDEIERIKHYRRMMRKRFNLTVGGPVGGRTPPIASDGSLMPDFYERFQTSGIEGIETTYSGKAVPPDQMEAAALIGKQIEQTDRLIKEVEGLRADQRKPVVSPRGMQEAN